MRLSVSIVPTSFKHIRPCLQVARPLSSQQKVRDVSFSSKLEHAFATQFILGFSFASLVSTSTKWQGSKLTVYTKYAIGEHGQVRSGPRIDIAQSRGLLQQQSTQLNQLEARLLAKMVDSGLSGLRPATVSIPDAFQIPVQATLALIDCALSTPPGTALPRLRGTRPGRWSAS